MNGHKNAKKPTERTHESTAEDHLIMKRWKHVGFALFIAVLIVGMFDRVSRKDDLTETVLSAAGWVLGAMVVLVATAAAAKWHIRRRRRKHYERRLNVRSSAASD